MIGSDTYRRGLNKEQLQKALILINELKARGVELPPDLVVPDLKPEVKWNLDSNGYFVRKDGWVFKPRPVLEEFIQSNARFILLKAGRGCISGDTKIGGIPISDRILPDYVETLYGKSMASRGYLKGQDNLYRVTTQFGSSVRVTEHHRFLTPAGWLPLNQLSPGSLVLSDGTLSVTFGSQKSSDSLDYYSEGFHLNGELHDLLEQVSLSILQQLHTIVGDNSALYLDDLLSIVDFSTLMLFRFCVEYSFGLISHGQLPNLLHKYLQFLYRTFQNYKVPGEYPEEISFYDRISRLSQLICPTDLVHNQLQVEKLHSGMLSLLGTYQRIGKDFLYPSTLDAVSVIPHERDFLSSFRHDRDIQHLTYDRFSSMSRGIDEILYQLGIHSVFPELFEQLNPTKDFYSLVGEGQIYQRILQLYAPEHPKYLETLRYMRNNALPAIISVLVRSLSFLGDQSFDLLNIKYKDNSIIQFDKIQDVKFDRFGDYYDISVPGTEHYLAEGLYHHNSGKTVAGCQKALLKIRQGESGAVMNPDFENFRTSTWPELQKWIPWDMVVPSHRYRANQAWEAIRPFTVVFMNGAKMYCKGLKDPESARGANLNWFWYDEGRRDPTGLGWKNAIAFLRVGNEPQAWCTTTMAGLEHWTNTFFQGEGTEETKSLIAELRKKGITQPLFANFKTSTKENEENLDPVFYASLVSTYPAGHLRTREIDGEAADEGGSLGDRRWFDGKGLDGYPDWAIKNVRFWDLAATEQKILRGKKLNDPDETVGSLVGFDMNKNILEARFCLQDQFGGWWEWSKIKEYIIEIAKRDGAHVEICFEQEPASGGKNQIAELRDFIKKELPEWKTSSLEAKKLGDRVLAANTWFAEASRGQWYYTKGLWNEKFFSQLDRFNGVSHDDRITSVTGARHRIAPLQPKWSGGKFVSI